MEIASIFLVVFTVSFIAFIWWVIKVGNQKTKDKEWKK